MKLTSAGLAIGLLLSLGACSRDRDVQAAEGQKARVVKMEAAQIKDVRRQVDVVGTLAAREEVVVSAEVAGRVARLVHDLGDRVAAGAPLIELGIAAMRAEGQRAALDQARARYGASGDGELPGLDKVPAVVSTTAQLADAQQQLDRAKNLSARNLLSRSDLETAQTRFDTAKAAHDQALASARQLRADIERSPRRCGSPSASCAMRSSARRSTATSPSGSCPRASSSSRRRRSCASCGCSR
jgi:multidrug efflux pump subunit AcrA (membrane-fusion protein)